MGATIEWQAPKADSQLLATLEAILDPWAKLLEWQYRILEIDNSRYDSESGLFEALSDLDSMAFGLALRDVAPALLVAIGVDNRKLEDHHLETLNDASRRLHEVLQFRVGHGLPTLHNYFELLYLPPSELFEQIWDQPELGWPETPAEKHLTDYLPLGERMILSRLHQQELSLRSLHEKMDGIIESL